MLITDSSYQLPVVYALKPDKTFENGANKPLLIRGYNDLLKSEGEYVIKCVDAERMKGAAFQRELLGCWAAWHVGLYAVEPVEVDISPDFLELMNGRAEYGMVSRSLGRNFGSSYEQGFREFITGQPLTDAEKEQAYLIFAFDVLLNNVDRNATKQNMLTNGQQIMLLDHELGFSFTQVFSFLRSPEPWLLQPNDVSGWIEKHYFFPQLRGQQFDFTTLTPALQRLDSQFWQAARQHIPPTWRTPEIDDIEAHISQVLAHVSSFTQELNRVTQ
ncbi:hypothetical protein F1C16_20090 (plasmid) [Hymenobacter sp. NBH84]|uniref:HipA family kinase n=1 Tax=Hymenobacter sp. NBH84 TaxID=2596915 RepID=UPI0016289BCB|nr:HipA family kinase [Hymenobacter sp. NBH84]QNE41933.1 hypothetical protein F1C16_20090 [Hymenobacter sp. NBH84]